MNKTRFARATRLGEEQTGVCGGGGREGGGGKNLCMREAREARNLCTREARNLCTTLQSCNHEITNFCNSPSVCVRACVRACVCVCMYVWVFVCLELNYGWAGTDCITVSVTRLQNIPSVAKPTLSAAAYARMNHWRASRHTAAVTACTAEPSRTQGNRACERLRLQKGQREDRELIEKHTRQRRTQEDKYVS